MRVAVIIQKNEVVSTDLTERISLDLNRSEGDVGKKKENRIRMVI